MILVLTYHQVGDTSAGKEPNFYTISGAQLDQQISVLHEKGHHGWKIEQLLRGTTVPERSYALTFDDGTSDHYEVVFPWLEKHHDQGVFFIPTARLNQPGFLTNAQVKEMAAAGHTIATHSHEHRRMDILPDDEIRRQIALSQKIIADLTGANPSLFAPPGGFVNDRVRAIAMDLGVRVLRTMRWGYNEPLNPMALETIPINRYVTGRKFMKVLESRRRPLLYAGKETVKKLVPLPAYERLRKLIFKISKSG